MRSQPERDTPCSTLATPAQTLHWRGPVNDTAAEYAQQSEMNLRDSEQWFAIQTYSKHESKIAAELMTAGITVFFPTTEEVRQWSDRRKVLQVPLFSCYVFVKVALSDAVYLRILRVSGVLRWLTLNGTPCEIPPEQVEAVRRVIASGIASSPHPFLQSGDRVRVHGGCLEGLEGILESDAKGNKLVLTVEQLHRSICISGDCYTFERCQSDSRKV